MRFYGAVLGLPVEIHTMGDSPMTVPEELRDRIMHASIRSETLVLMASDTMPGMPTPGGSQVHLSLAFETHDEQDRVWAALAEGGQITMPLADQFFGRFGTLIDRYGVQWMFILEPKRD